MSLRSPVSADYYQTMAVIERRMALPEDRLASPPGLGQLLALVDSLREGPLNEAQTETVNLCAPESWPWQNGKELFRMLMYRLLETKKSIQRSFLGEIAV